LLVTILMTGKLSMDYVDDVGTFLSNNMAFFFIPAAVSVIEYLDLLESNIFKILVIIVLTTIISFLAIYGSVLLTLKLMKREEA
ncbi:MAG TPA: CidA/LrgA family protein, partial [Acholeplasmataceae bacterium]|nr:CidA/LrgA family protein [Acholeplasmataceae bacterium]